MAGNSYAIVGNSKEEQKSNTIVIIGTDTLSLIAGAAYLR